MPRHARQKSNTGIYHVMLRGNNRATIFHDDEDCEKFLDVLRVCQTPLEKAGGEADDPEGRGHSFSADSRRGQSLSPTCGVTKGQAPTSPTSAKYFAYCLMDNHVHLLLQEGAEPIQQIIKRIGVRYASYYNWKYLRTGHLFQDRFRSEPIEDDRYLLAVFRYIALNPVKAGIAEHAGEYPWASYRPLQAQSPSSLISALPLDASPEQLEEFVLSEQPSLNPFPERISDREAESILLQVTGLKRATDFPQLPKAEQKRFFAILQEECLSIQQMARLTGVAKSNIARYLA